MFIGVDGLFAMSCLSFSVRGVIAGGHRLHLASGVQANAIVPGGG